MSCELSSSQLDSADRSKQVPFGGLIENSNQESKLNVREKDEVPTLRLRVVLY